VACLARHLNHGLSFCEEERDERMPQVVGTDVVQVGSGRGGSEDGGTRYFEPVNELSDGSPTHEHFPISKREGGHRNVDNAILAHRLCNRIDYSINIGRPHARDLERVRKAREEATRRNNERRD
jgi:hypothetical protein